MFYLVNFAHAYAEIWWRLKQQSATVEWRSTNSAFELIGIHLALGFTQICHAFNGIHHGFDKFYPGFTLVHLRFAAVYNDFACKTMVKTRQNHGQNMITTSKTNLNPNSTVVKSQ